MAGGNIQNERFPKTVERRIENWAKEREAVSAQLRGGVAVDYITISRELGSGGEEVAKELSELMKWKLYDKDILNYMSENLQVHKSVLESVDERTVSWIEDLLMPLFTNKTTQHVEQLTYFKHLMEVLLVIAKHGQAIIVGRAAGLVLPRKLGLSVRVTAPFDLRCERYAKKHDKSLKEATGAVKKFDKNQIKFVKSFLNKNILDSKHYDIVCSTEKLTPKSVAKLIWRTFDQRVLIEKEQTEAAGQE